MTKIRDLGLRKVGCNGTDRVLQFVVLSLLSRWQQTDIHTTEQHPACYGSPSYESIPPRLVLVVYVR